MKRKVIGTVLGILVLAAALVPVAALAQDDTGPAAAGQFVQDFLEKLAIKLGVDKNKLADAVKQTELEMVDEAVQQGKLDSDRAESIKSRIEKGQLFCLRPFGRPGPGHFGGRRLDLLAGVLGMSADDLRARLEQGAKLEDLAKEKGLTLNELQQKLRDAQIQEIQQAVKDGKITQDQADKMIERLKNAPLGGGLRGFGPPPGRGRAFQTEQQLNSSKSA